MILTRQLSRSHMIKHLYVVVMRRSVVVFIVVLFVIWSLLYLISEVDKNDDHDMFTNGNVQRQVTFQRNRDVTSDVYNVAHRKPVWDISSLCSRFDDQVKCDKGAVLMILITSARHHREHRKSIRNSWCHPTNCAPKTCQCVFLLGQSSMSETSSDLLFVNSTINQEMLKYRDILLGSYTDVYRHLTHKVMHGYYWANRRCRTPYILKTDDDCFVNTKLILHFLSESQTISQNLYVGRVNIDLTKRLVVRDKTSRWFVSVRDYPHKHYPPYTSGIGYLLSRDVIDKIVDIAPSIKRIPVEDAYFGILVNAINITPIISPRFMITNMGWHTCNFRYMFVIHDVEPSEQYKMAAMATEAMEVCKDEVQLTWN